MRRQAICSLNNANKKYLRAKVGKVSGMSSPPANDTQPDETSTMHQSQSEPDIDTDPQQSYSDKAIPHIVDSTGYENKKHHFLSLCDRLFKTTAYVSSPLVAADNEHDSEECGSDYTDSLIERGTASENNKTKDLMTPRTSFEETQLNDDMKNKKRPRKQTGPNTSRKNAQEHDTSLRKSRRLRTHLTTSITKGSDNKKRVLTPNQQRAWQHIDAQERRQLEHLMDSNWSWIYYCKKGQTITLLLFAYPSNNSF